MIDVCISTPVVKICVFIIHGGRLIIVYCFEKIPVAELIITGSFMHEKVKCGDAPYLERSNCEQLISEVTFGIWKQFVTHAQ